MTSTDDPITSWRSRVSGLRSPVTSVDIDVKRGDRPPPERLSAAEAALWRKLVDARRPGWFGGALELLESYCVTVIQVQAIEAQLRKMRPSAAASYQRLARLHRQCVAQASLLATRLRLTPGARISPTQPVNGDVPMP